VVKTDLWRKLTEAQLREHPLCCFCASQGAVTRATVIDHRLPWSPADGQISLCTECFDWRQKGIAEQSFAGGADLRGYPLDPAHPWYRQK
jgi:5-methylcytosine-specific restriction protein A